MRQLHHSLSLNLRRFLWTRWRNTNHILELIIKRELYDALVKSYNTEKDLFDTYGEVFSLKRSRDNKDKDQDPSTGSDRGTKRRKSSKDAELSRDLKLPMQRSQDEAAPKNDWFKKPKRPLTPDPDWNKRQHVDFRPPETWISVIAHAEKPPTSFYELMDTPIDFSAFVMNRLNITNLTQELLVGLTFNLLKGTCKSRTELEYHFEECFKATTEQLDWHNPEGKQYPFDLHKPLLLILNHRVTKTKAATYEVQWIEDMVHNLVKDVYSRKRTIAVTRLTIMKRYDYGHLDKIEVRREDQHLYKFKEGD
ncbi:hypothetical protein Tco_1529555, partial [Tanacetum coccineum]